MIEAAQVTQAPEALVGNAFLAAVSLACQNAIDVQRLEGLKGPCSLLMITLAESGERKSAVDKLATKAFHAFDEQQAERAKKASIRHQAALTAWEIESKVVMSAIAKAVKKGLDVSTLTQQLEQIYGRKPIAPICRKMLYDDTTSAAFKYELRHPFSSVGLFSDEAKAVVNAGILDDLAMLNKAWDGGKMHITRRTTESFDVTNPRVTTSLSFQPKIFSNAFREEKSDARHIGYFARMLPAYPISTQGGRLIYGPIAPSGHLDRFHQRVGEILHQNFSAIEAGTHERKTLRFSNEAQQRWICAYNNVELSLGPCGQLSDIKDWGSKFAENVARIAALFHYFEGAEGDEISLDTLNQAGAIGDWYLAEFKRLFSPPAPIPQDQLDANALEAWLRSFCHTHKTLFIKKNVALQSGPNALRNKGRLNAALQVLVWRYVVKISEDKKTKFICLNPEYFLGKNGSGQLIT